MRLRQSRLTWTHYWPEPIIRMQNDETTIYDWYCSHDHLAGIGAVMAIPCCSHLRSDLACACGNSADNRQERNQTQLRDTFAFGFAVPSEHRHLRPVNLSCQQISDR